MSVDAPTRRAHQLDTVLDRAAAWYERLQWTRPQIEAHQERLLRRLLAHAIERSPFHAERLGGVDPATFTLDRLRELPVMTKTEMMADFDRVVTDPAVTRSAVEAHLADVGDELTYLHGSYVVMASGGSSGLRGMFVYDDEGFTSYVLTLARETLHTVRSLGVTSERPIHAAMVAAGSAVHGSAAVCRLVGVAPSPVILHPIPATLPFDEMIARIEAVQPLSLIAYGSILPYLAAATADGRLTISPFVVSGTSELLPPATRRAAEQAFGVPIGNTFGASEGLVGIAPPGQDAIRFAEDTCIVELVDDDGRPVARGEEASKVYVTNLVNLAQPLIRYELTDRFREVVDEWPDGYLRAVVEGRTDEPLRWGGVTVHPLTIRGVLVKHPAIVEYQVRQTAGGIAVSIVLTDRSGPATDALASELAAALRQAGLTDASVAVEVTDRIARDPVTGKPRRFVPLA